MTQARSIRELVDEKIALFRDLDALDPNQIAQEVVELSSLWASIQKELVDREMWWNELMKILLEKHGTASAAQIHGKASPEYRQLLEATAYSKSVQEMIRTSKKFLSLNEQTMRESRFN